MERLLRFIVKLPLRHSGRALRYQESQSRQAGPDFRHAVVHCAHGSPFFIPYFF